MPAPQSPGSPDPPTSPAVRAAVLLILGGLVILGQPMWRAMREMGREAAVADIAEIYGHAAHAGSAWSPRRTHLLLLLGTVLGAMAIGHLLALGAAARGRLRAPGAWALLGFAAAIALATPPTLSTDVLSYSSRGHLLASLGLNPYHVAPGDVDQWLSDPLLRADPWTGVRCIYGFAWTHVMGLVRLAAGPQVFWNVMAHKALEAAALAVFALLCWGLWPRGDSHGRVATVVFAGLLPAALLETANNAHNEGVMMALWLGAIAAALRGSAASAGLLLGLAAGIKWAPLAAAPLVALHLARQRRRRSAALFTAVFGLALTVPSLPFEPWRSETWFGLSNQSRTFGGGSMAAVLGDVLMRLTGEPVMLLRAAQATQVLWLSALAAIFLLALLRPSPPEASRDRLLADIGWAAMATATLGSPFFAPWYALWALPFAVLARRHAPGLAGLALGLGLAAPFSLLPPIALGHYGPEVQRLMFLVWSLPALAGLLMGRRLGHRSAAM